MNFPRRLVLHPAALLWVITALSTSVLQAQSGELSFTGASTTTNVNAATITNVSATTLSGGTLTLGNSGTFTTNPGSVATGGAYYGTASTPRTLGAGSRDVSFGYRTGADGTVYSVAVQPDGKIIVAGDFKNVDAIPAGKIARLNPDGSLDATFNAGTGADDHWIRSVVLQPDGKLLVAGGFTSINGVARPGIARLNADGSLDPAFTLGEMFRISWPEVVAGGPPASFSGYATSVTTTTNTSISLPAGTIAGLPGTIPVVTTPQYTLLSGGQINALALQPDGKVIIGGGFYQIDGVVRYNLARLNTDGSLDTAFDPGLRASHGNSPNYAAGVSALALQSDGKLLVAGNDSGTSSGVLTSLVRLNADATADAAFQTVVAASHAPLYTNSTWNGSSMVQTSYYDYRYSDTTVPNALGIQAVVVQPDGKILAAGIACQFDLSGGKISSNVALYNADGSPDAAFVASPDDRGVYSLALQTDGKVLAAGSYSTVADPYYLQDGAPARSGLARLNTDGTTDNRFTARSLSSSWNAYAVAVQPGDGKVLVGGDFYTMEGTGIRGVARLNPASPVVTVAVDSRKISRAAGDSAVLTFTRSGDDTSSETTVSYSITGSLQNGTDFARLSGRAHIKAGETSHAVKIKPTADGAAGKISITLATGADYEMGGQGTASVKVGK